MLKIVCLLTCAISISACTSGGSAVTGNFNRNPDLISKEISLAGHNTFSVNGEYVTLYGIEPVYLSQKCLSSDKRIYDCGKDLMNYLRDVLPKAKSVRCFFANDYQATYVGNRNHLPMHCFVNGLNLNEQLVSAGYALAYDPLYAAAESVAKSERAGVWQGQFMHPLDYASFTSNAIDANLELYKGVRVYSPAKDNGEACVVKAVVRDGRKIYLVPGDEFYELTKINNVLGDRLLCSEHEALESGFARVN